MGRGVRTSATAINMARTDRHWLELVPERRRVLIGQVRTRGHGAGADNELGATVTMEDQASDGETVIVDEVTLPDGGYVVI